MPGIYKYVDIEIITKSNVFHQLIFKKEKQKALFLVYIVHACRYLFLYEIVRGTAIRLADTRKLRRLPYFARRTEGYALNYLSARSPFMR